MDGGGRRLRGGYAGRNRRFRPKWPSPAQGASEIPESVTMRSPVLFDAIRYILVDVSPVAYPQDIYDLTFDFENDAIISHPELPIPLQTLP